jgi:hypothetical protein
VRPRVSMVGSCCRDAWPVIGPGTAPAVTPCVYARWWRSPIRTCIGGKLERRDGRTGQALTAERRPMSLRTHDGGRAHMRVEGYPQVSLIPTDPSRRVGLNRASDQLGGSGQVRVMVGSAHRLACLSG